MPRRKTPRPPNSSPNSGGAATPRSSTPLDTPGWWLFAAILILSVAFAAWKYNPSSTPAPALPASTATDTTTDTTADAPSARPFSPHLLLGNPSAATPDPAHRDNFLITRNEYALSYNEPNGTPNWVAWRLRQEDTGDAPRKPSFDPDPLLPQGFYQVTHRDYSNSGFDRGHMCPHSDRDATRTSSDATFVMTNIIPQAPNVNQRAWATLENYSRALIATPGVERTLYIISGPWGRGGTGSKGRRETLANGKVQVPAECWKIILIDDNNVRSPSDITATARVIAVKMPNDDSKVDLEWASFRLTPAEVEQQTGLTFFSALRPEVAQTLRQKLDTQRIAPPPIPKYLRDQKK